MDKQILIGLSVVAVIIIGYLLLAMDQQYVMSSRPEIRPAFNESNQSERFHSFVPPQMPFTALFGLLFLLLIPVILLYSNMQLQKKLADSSELLTKLVDRSSGPSGRKRAVHEPSAGRELVARLIDPKEMAVIDRLIEKPKGIPQAEIVDMPGMTKLKAHRVVERLRQKGIITVQRSGKTNFIRLDARTKSLLSGLE
ncbi:Uncharacterised protein [uncultured archaeon]|nr:Uncharacterised protein [uncultured archaeon]